MSIRCNFLSCLACLALLAAAPARAANWNIAIGNWLVLDTTSASELSGVTYLGPAPTAGQHRFLAVQDNGNGLVAFDAAFDLTGQLVSATAIAGQPLATSFDDEGIAHVEGTVFVSEETHPGVAQYDPATGNLLQSVPLPAVFTSHSRPNFGLESLTYDAANSTLWTANEEALTVDGPLATSGAGSTVRLLALDTSGPSAGQQFAYLGEPIHGLALGSARSGLVDLVAMPDGTLLALERSAAVHAQLLLNRLFEIDLAGATDVSQGLLADGLSGQSYTPVGKTSRWSGSIGDTGQNLEGLALGPRLPNGDWLLLGVVDNGDSYSDNTIVAFTASPTVPLPLDPATADFDQEGTVAGADFLRWQRGYGATTLSGLGHGDGNRDGLVNSADLALWQSAYGAAPLVSVPEPTALVLCLLAAACAATRI